VPFPRLLEPIDDLPPVTIITSVTKAKGGLIIRGISQDNGDIALVRVNSVLAATVASSPGIIDWEAIIRARGVTDVTARAVDRAGNAEKKGHRVELGRR
jgi:hypothetical protein